MAADDLLQPIRDRAGAVARLGPPRDGGEVVNALAASAADVPVLLEAAAEVLRLADRMENAGPPVTDLVDRVHTARHFREAVERAMAGTIPARNAALKDDTSRSLLETAEKALMDCVKAALTVKPVLDTPYPELPQWTPYTRWVERPAQRAHDLSMQIRKYLRENR